MMHREPSNVDLCNVGRIVNCKIVHEIAHYEKHMNDLLVEKVDHL